MRLGASTVSPIEEAILDLALQPFDAAEFQFALLAAFGNKVTALKRLHNSNNNSSDVPSSVLQRNNVHIAVCDLALWARPSRRCVPAPP